MVSTIYGFPRIVPDELSGKKLGSKDVSVRNLCTRYLFNEVIKFYRHENERKERKNHSFVRSCVSRKFFPRSSTEFLSSDLNSSFNLERSVYIYIIPEIPDLTSPCIPSPK